jgi:hypothetical protein
MVIFIVAEILIGILIGNIIVGRYVSMGLKFMMQGLCMIGAFFAGGVVVGFISPGLRIFEPACGAFLSVTTMMFISWLTPNRFYGYSLEKALLGGTLAFVLAMIGAKIGEKLSGNKV